MAKRLALNIDYQKCRRWGHMWDDIPPVNRGGRKVLSGPRVTLRCERCSMIRDDIYDSLGQIAARNYDQPEGYAMLKDEVPSTGQLNLSLATTLKASQRLGTPTKRQPRRSPAPKKTARTRADAHTASRKKQRHLSAVG